MTLKPNLTLEDWKEAQEHFREVYNAYRELRDTPGANVEATLRVVFEPLLLRFFNDERTQDLFEDMMAVK